MTDMVGFMPHGSCFLWHLDILTLHVASDALIAAAYFCIPILTLRFVRHRRVLWTFAGAFSTFIFACGVTHVMDIWTIWHPDYWLAGALKAVCAVASVATAVALLPFMPYAAALRKLAMLDRRNTELESQFVHIAQTTTDGIWIFDAMARTLSCNERITAMLEYSADELAGRSMFDLMQAGRDQSAFHPFTNAGLSNTDGRVFCFRRKSGADLWAELYFHPAYDAQGTFSGAVATVVDIGERLRSRLALEENERRYRSLAEAMPQMIWTANPQGNVQYANQNWQDYTATTFDDVAPETVWAATIHPLDVQRFRAHWLEALSTGQPHEGEYRFLHAIDGTYRWHIARVSPIRHVGGTIEQWVGSFTDIHDYKLAIETRQILDLIGDIVLICSEDDVTVYANPHWTSFTGASTTSFGFRWRNFIHPDDLKAFDAHKRERYELGVDSLEYELRIRARNGEYRWFLVRTAALPGAPVQPRRWLKTLTDIEDLKRVQSALALDVERTKKSEALLAELHEASVAATEAKSRFLATMSHEIRTPMNGIIGMAELLLFSALDTEQLECVRIIHDSSRSLLRVLNDILDYSKVEAGKLELEIVAFDLRRQIESVVGLLRPQFAAKGVRLASFVDELLPDRLFGDPGRLRQVLLNLVGNAHKFTPPGGTVTITVERAAAGERSVPIRFTVHDTGIGIREAALGRLFKPFSQADNSTTRRYGGTGLGLSICANLVSLMRGTIGVESTPGEGSTFWFVVPFESAAEAPRVPLLEPDAPSAARERTRTGKVLVAEDNAVNLLVARKQFAKLGFEITSVASGREAVELLARERFDIIFMDCHMPDLDGFAATVEIRRLEADQTHRTPIIALTADAREDDRLRCLSAGMDDYVSKPTTLAKLEEILDRWCPGLLGGGESEFSKLR